jgi:hypothetical protein
MNNKVTVWFVTLSLLSLTACHKNRISKNTDQSVNSGSTAVVADSSRSDSAVTTEAVTEPVKIQEVAFDYLTAKSKFSFQSKKQNFDNANINIRMKKDSLIWISVTGVGFEVARGLITRDSIFFMDKFHREYFVLSYAQLSRQYNFDINFSILQAIVIGNLPFPQQPGAMFMKEDDFFVLKQQAGRINIDNYIGPNFKLTRLDAAETGTNNTFSLHYEDFKDVKSFLFPFSSLVTLHVKAPKEQQLSKTTIQLKHSRVELLDQTPGFPFSIPSGYSRKK